MAVIGSGYWGKNLVRNFHDIQALSTVCESDQKILKALGDSYPTLRLVQDFQSVLGDSSIHAVAIATPAETHATLVRQSLLAG
ncbi:MAG: Gfo/Idh/MocA family oxidoreductase, partial [Nitrospira sp.]|nr:Gfo/Idh/MocA family oxidoreductase [Nitrospira sp.]